MNNITNNFTRRTQYMYIKIELHTLSRSVKVIKLAKIFLTYIHICIVSWFNCILYIINARPSQFQAFEIWFEWSVQRGATRPTDESVKFQTTSL